MFHIVRDKMASCGRSHQRSERTVYVKNLLSNDIVLLEHIYLINVKDRFHYLVAEDKPRVNRILETIDLYIVPDLTQYIRSRYFKGPRQRSERCT